MTTVMCANGHRINAPDKFAGKKVKCPKCGVTLVIPPLAAEEFVIATSVVAHAESASTVFDPFGDLSGLPNSDAGFPGGFGETAPELGTFVPSVAAQQSAVIAPKIGRNAQPSKSNNSRLLLFAGLGLLGITVPIISIGGMFWMLRSGGSSDVALNGTTIAATAIPSMAADKGPLKESSVLKNAVITHMHARAKDNGSNWLETEDFFEFTRKHLLPTFAMVTDVEQRRLESNKKSPALQKRIELLQTGVRAISRGTGDMAGAQGLPDDAIGQRVQADVLHVSWRTILAETYAHRELTPQLCEIIRNIENSCFGPDSIFLDVGPSAEEKLLNDLVNSVKLASVAILNYESTYRQLPTQFANKARGLSWRVALLPYLDQVGLYNEFHLDEPWDSEHNIKLIERMPKEYNTGAGTRKTSAHIVLSDKGVFSGETSKRIPSGVPDGVDRTLLVIIGGLEIAQEWTKPGAIEFDPNQGMSQFGKPPIPKGYPIATVNGRQRLVPANTSAADLASLVFVSDGLPTPAKMQEFAPLGTSQDERIRRIRFEIKTLVESASSK